MVRAWVAGAVLVAGASGGCSSSGRRSIVGSSVSNSAEPTLTPETPESGVTIVNPGAATAAVVPPASAGSTKALAFVDRHPLLRKPQEYYDNTNSNKVVKTAAATFVGVPAGIVGELKQIVVGRPTGVTPAIYRTGSSLR